MKQERKNQITSFVAIVAIFLATSSAQAAKVNISTALGSTLQADFAVSEKGSVNGILGLGGGSALGVGYNHMFSKSIMTSGWSVNSALMYYTGVTKGYTIGALAQYNAFWDNGFNINAGIGLQYAKLDVDSTLSVAGMLPNFGLNIGYSF